MASTRRITWSDFGPFLRTIRTRQHLTQEELGEMLSIGRVHVCRLEAGRRNPSRLLLRVLAGVPGVSNTERKLIVAFEEMCECHADEGKE